MWPSGTYPQAGFVMPWKRTVIRGSPLPDIKEATLLPGTNVREPTLHLAPLPIALRFFFIYFFLCSVRRGKKKIHLLTEAEHSKFEYLHISENYTFRKTKELHSKSFGSSPLTTVQDLLFQSFSSESTSQQGGRTHPKQLPLRQCRHEG